MLRHCMFGYPPPPKSRENFSFMVDPGFVDYVEECEAREAEEYWSKREEFELKYPTCWSRFLHFLRLR